MESKAEPLCKLVTFDRDPRKETHFHYYPAHAGVSTGPLEPTPGETALNSEDQAQVWHTHTHTPRQPIWEEDLVQPPLLDTEQAPCPEVGRKCGKQGPEPLFSLPGKKEILGGRSLRHKAWDFSSSQNVKFSRG